MRDLVMALILDVVKSDISLRNVFSWLENAIPQEDLKQIIKTDFEEARNSFPILLSAFIREKSSRILKWHNVPPEEQKTPKNKQDGLMPGVRDLTLSSPNISSKPCTPSQETRKIRKILPYRLDLQDTSAFPSLGQSPQTKELPKKRRINPTQLQEMQSSPKQILQFSYSPKSSPPCVKNVFSAAKEQVGQKNLDHERALLKEKKQQLTTLPIPDVGTNISKSWSCIEPDKDQVTCQHLLDRLSTLYAYCLTNNLLPSLYGEIKFLIELLVLRISPQKLSVLDPDEASVLDSVHNCVYFSTKTIEKLENIWCNVDRGFLQQLMCNPRLAAFSPNWVQQDLIEILNQTSGRTARPLKTISNVAFKTDTDNRFNFASDTSFQIFRKQRDLFCEIWQVWKANNSIPGWNTALGLRKMIQSLMDMKKDCVNYVHLARLFRSQLLDVAQLAETEMDEESDLFLSQLQSSDPDKLRRLKERLTNPAENNISRTSGIDAPYKLAFEGDQEFFRDFIILASNPSFNEHLKNSLINGIEELSRSEDFDDQERFADTVIALQVMAKFLAFLRFYPHLSEDHLPEHIFHHLSELRSAQKEPIDLLGHLSDAYIEGRLLLTVPWIVTYFSLADPVSLCLPDCHPVLGCLVYVYRRAEFHSKSAFVIRILLSWLFDQPYFPRPLLVTPDEELQSQFRAQTSSDTKRALLDNCPLVTSSLVYQCCPFIMTWKYLLTDFACLDAKSHTEKSAQTRKITPISADENPSPTKARTVKSLQCSLEENFFHNQPSSVKRTVDFVGERLASNIVRDIRHQIIPRLVQNAQATLKTWPRNADARKIEELSRELCSSVRKEAASVANAAVSSVDATLATLLPNDLLPSVREVCVSITTKLTREKVLDWLNLHVTLGLFKSDLETEWAKLGKATKRNETADVAAVKPVLPPAHDDSTWPPSTLADRLKTLICQIVRDEANVSRQDVAELLSRAEGTLLRRIDIMPAIFKCLQQLTFDFLFVLCVFQPESVVSDTVVAWVGLWNRTCSNIELPATSCDEAALSTPLSNSPWLVFAPKHLLLLAQSTSARQSWGHISTLVLQLLKSGLLRYADVHEQAIAVLRQQWPKEVLARFASCVNDIVDWHRGQRRASAASPGDENETVDDELLSWLSWFCSQEDLV